VAVRNARKQDEDDKARTKMRLQQARAKEAARKARLSQQELTEAFLEESSNEEEVDEEEEDRRNRRLRAAMATKKDNAPVSNKQPRVPRPPSRPYTANRFSTGPARATVTAASVGYGSGEGELQQQHLRL
jgi:hypothetical protein